MDNICQQNGPSSQHGAKTDENSSTFANETTTEEPLQEKPLAKAKNDTTDSTANIQTYQTSDQGLLDGLFKQLDSTKDKYARSSLSDISAVDLREMLSVNDNIKNNPMAMQTDSNAIRAAKSTTRGSNETVQCAIIQENGTSRNYFDNQGKVAMDANLMDYKLNIEKNQTRENAMLAALKNADKNNERKHKENLDANNKTHAETNRFIE